MTTVKRGFVCLAFLLIIPVSAHAQFDNVEDLLRGGVEDANSLLQAYLAPLGKGFGANLNNGWFTTAKPHKFLGFDLTVTANGAVAPLTDESFDLSSLNLQHVKLSAGATGSTTPTVVGDDVAGPVVDLVLNNPFTGQDEVITSYTMPAGIGFRYVPSPMIQGALGIGLGSEFVLRFFPDTEVSEDIGRLKMFGLGFKHNINSWLGEASSLPLDISLMAGYTVFEASSREVELLPDQDAIQTGANYDDQKIELEAKSFTANVIVSKKLSFFTIYGSLGYENSNMDLKLKGLYPVTAIEDDFTSPNFGQRAIRDLQDPIDISIAGANKMRSTAGFELNFVVLKIYGSYTFADYAVATAGAGLSIR